MSERIIHPLGEEKEITKEEYAELIQPYQQQVKLFESLVAWSRQAEMVLAENGYTNIFRYGLNNFLCWHPQKIETTKDEVQDADAVLRAIHEMHSALFQDDKNLIANAGIALGLAVSRAHAMPFEALAISGKKCKEGPSNRDKDIKREYTKEWLRENPDKVKHCKNVKDLRAIERLSNKALDVPDTTLKRWFNEIYPGQLKRGSGRS